MKTRTEKIINGVIFIIQIIASFIMLYIFYDIKFIPMNYFIGLAVVLVGMLIGEYFLIFNKKPKSKRSIITQAFSVILSVFMIIASSYAYKMGEVVDLVSSKSFQKRAISVIVLNHSTIRNERQLPKQKVGYISSIDKESMDFAIADMTKNIGKIELKDYKDFAGLVDDLYNQKVAAIILDEAFRTLVEQDKEDFDMDTRVIYQVLKDESFVHSNRVDVTEKPFLVYISGNDQYGEISSVSRSDVNMLVAINPKTKQILLISIPRDSYYPLHRNGQLDKFTHAGIYGLQESINTLEDIMDEQINYYVRMNFTSFMNIVDSLGGITINSPAEFTTKIGKFHIKKGINELNAREALAFVRERKSFAAGDFERGKNQQRMIAAIVDKVCSPVILTSFSSILDTVSTSIDTNLSSEEMRALVQLQLTKMPSWDIQTYQIIGDTGMRPCYSSGGREASVVILYNSSIKQAQSYIDDLMSDKMIQTETGNLNQKETKNNERNYFILSCQY